jgi:hypothetical protein
MSSGKIERGREVVALNAALSGDDAEPVQRRHVFRRVHCGQIVYCERIGVVAEQVVYRRGLQIDVIAYIAQKWRSTD